MLMLIGISLQASSDMFFWALFFSALATAAYADNKDNAYIWIMSGAVVGMAVMTLPIIQNL